ncbi:hypothetical protein SSYM_2043 [Serratia symbiotica str. Tucson]|uniref:Uncharacterized protein n=1 Tax=Serratia symbiotica str. Tucson TaxID=914128 RepID=E9CNN1_9GAMM|nr:hypothetical protein SSYM_2043 [Serratia symbiotica str. Tucson]
MFEELIVETDSVLLFAELGVIGGITPKAIPEPSDGAGGLTLIRRLRSSSSP